MAAMISGVKTIEDAFEIQRSGDRRLFFRWIRRPFHSLELLLFLVRRFYYKYVRKSLMPGVHNYPVEIRDLFERLKKQQEYGLEVGYPDHISQIAEVEAVRLATIYYPTRDNRIDWGATFDDGEDLTALHRFGWINDLSSGAYEDNWVIAQISKWPYWGHSLSSECEGLVWEPYTIAERCSSLVLRFSTNMPNAIKSFVARQAMILSHRLEYHGPFTGNHVFNNARGLYLASLAIGNPELKRFSLAVLKREFELLVNNVGEFREGSSHYQWLFTSWLGDMAIVSGDFEDENTLFFQDGFKRLYAVSCLLHQGHRDMPLIGDVSPDLPPALTSEKVHRQAIALQVESTELNFEDLSGWAGVKGQVSSFLSRVSIKSNSCHVGHDHQDYFHFIYSYNSLPILVDPIRPSYEPLLNNQVYTSAVKHNVILIDGVAESTFAKTKYPVSFTQSIRQHYCRNNEVFLVSNGFRRLGLEEVSRRITLTEDGSLQVEDCISSYSHERLVETYWYFDPNVKLVEGKSSVSVLFDEEFLFTVDSDKDASFAIENPSERMKFQSPQYGHRVDLPFIVVTSRGAKKVRYTIGRNS